MPDPAVIEQIAQLIAGPSRFQQRLGATRLREGMGGAPGLFGPANEALYGVPLRGKSQAEVQAEMDRQAAEALAISQAVPRGQ